MDEKKPIPQGQKARRSANRPAPEKGVAYPTLREWLATLRARDYDREFVLREGMLVHSGSGKGYKPGKIRVTGMHHVQGKDDQPHVLFLLQATDGTRGWIAEMGGKGPSRSLSAFLDKVLAAVDIKREENNGI